MDKLAEIINLAKEIPENYLDEAYNLLKTINEKAYAEEKSKIQSCLRCGSNKVVKNGKKSGKQAYICRDCKKKLCTNK